MEKKQIMVSRQYGFGFGDNGLIRPSVKVVVYFSNALSHMDIILWNFGFRKDKTEKQRHKQQKQQQQKQRKEKNSKTILTILTNGIRLNKEIKIIKAADSLGELHLILTSH